MSYLKRRAMSFVATLTLLIGTVAVAQQATITRSSNFRQSPSTQSKILGSLQPGDSVTLTSNKKTKGYFPAETSSGTPGWVWAKNVSIKSNLSTLRLNVAPAPALTPGEFTASCAHAAFPGPSTVMDHTGLGAGQLEFRAFDLGVLEHYRNDPRYYYWTDSIHGNIGVKNSFYQSEKMAERDQVLLQTFGFAYDDDMNRAVAVFLRYLSDLSPEHQRTWSAKEAHGNFKLHPDYYRTSIIGDWGERISVFDAFVAELRIVNEMCSLMSRPPLFRRVYEEKPEGFEFLLRPTTKELHSFCLLLDKMMSENINKSFFRGEVPVEDEKERPDGKIVVTQKGTIVIFEAWLRRYFHTPEQDVIDKIFSSFREVRKTEAESGTQN